MPKPVTFFEQALAEEGIDGDVTHESNNGVDIFTLRKEVAGHTLRFSHGISIADNYGVSDEKQIAMAAAKVRNEVENALTHHMEWQDRSIDINLYRGPSATCRNCSTEVDLSQTNRIFEQCAELSSPQPRPAGGSGLLESMDDHSEVMLKMFLLGRLRAFCDDHCTNARSAK